MTLFTGNKILFSTSKEDSGRIVIYTTSSVETTTEFFSKETFDNNSEIVYSTSKGFINNTLNDIITIDILSNFEANYPYIVRHLNWQELRLTQVEVTLKTKLSDIEFKWYNVGHLPEELKFNSKEFKLTLPIIPTETDFGIKITDIIRTKETVNHGVSGYSGNHFNYSGSLADNLNILHEIFITGSQSREGVKVQLVSEDGMVTIELI